MLCAQPHTQSGIAVSPHWRPGKASLSRRVASIPAQRSSAGFQEEGGRSHGCFDLEWFLPAGLGGLWCDDSALHWDPAAAVVLEQEKIRHPQDQKELRVAPWAPPELRREQTEQRRAAPRCRGVRSAAAAPAEGCISALLVRGSPCWHRSAFSHSYCSEELLVWFFFVALVRVEVRRIL